MSAAPKKSYFELAKEAIAALKERTGSSAQAIKAHIVANHPTIKFAQHLLRAALNKGSETGKFVKVKASFKLAADEKKVKKVAVKKAAPAAVAKKAAAPKVVAKAATKKAPVAKKGDTERINSTKHYQQITKNFPFSPHNLQPQQRRRL